MLLRIGDLEKIHIWQRKREFGPKLEFCNRLLSFYEALQAKGRDIRLLSSISKKKSEEKILLGHIINYTAL